MNKIPSFSLWCLQASGGRRQALNSQTTTSLKITQWVLKRGTRKGVLGVQVANVLTSSSSTFLCNKKSLYYSYLSCSWLLTTGRSEEECCLLTTIYATSHSLLLCQSSFIENTIFQGSYHVLSLSIGSGWLGTYAFRSIPYFMEWRLPQSSLNHASLSHGVLPFLMGQLSHCANEASINQIISLRHKWQLDGRAGIRTH